MKMDDEKIGGISKIHEIENKHERFGMEIVH